MFTENARSAELRLVISYAIWAKYSVESRSIRAYDQALLLSAEALSSLFEQEDMQIASSMQQNHVAITLLVIFTYPLWAITYKNNPFFIP